MKRADRVEHKTLWAGPCASLAWVVAGLVMVLVMSGCDEKEFGEQDQAEIQKLLQTGVDLDGDPYVQAETLRVLEMIGEPSMNKFAEKLVDRSTDPMVRVAALRVLMSTGADGVRQKTLTAFGQASVAEKQAILDAAFEFGSPPLKRVVTKRALNSSDPKLRREAFMRGPIARLERALDEENTALLENTLFPDIGTYVAHDDEVLAAAALSSLVKAGQAARAQPLLKTLKDDTAEHEERVVAARVLGRARVKAAVPVFEKILESVEVNTEGAFVVPKRINKELIHEATLGLVANGNTKFVKQAQSYMTNAEVDETLRVLDALSTNPAEDAVINLKIAMQDARKPVRYQAIEMYAEHDKAKADAFISAMRGTDFESEKRLARVLARRFPEGWAEHLSGELEDDEDRQKTLELLRDVIVSQHDAKVLEPLSEQLYELAASDDDKIGPLAALLLIKVADDDKSQKLLAKVEEPYTRYAYVEHLVRTAPDEHVEYFRKNFTYSDLYAVRLMSAAGILMAADKGSGAEAGEAKQAKNDEGEAS